MPPSAVLPTTLNLISSSQILPSSLQASKHALAKSTPIFDDTGSAFANFAFPSFMNNNTANNINLHFGLSSCILLLCEQNLIKYVLDFASRRARSEFMAWTLVYQVALWSIKLHFASRWTKSDEIDVGFCFSESKVWILGLNFCLSSCTLVYQVALCFSVNKIWWNKCCILLLGKQSILTLWHGLWSIKLHFGISRCTLVYPIKLHLASRWTKSD